MRKKIFSFQRLFQFFLGTLSRKFTVVITFFFFITAALFMAVFTQVYFNQQQFEWRQTQKKLEQLGMAISKSVVLKSHLKNLVEENNLQVSEQTQALLESSFQTEALEGMSSLMQDESNIREHAVKIGALVIVSVAVFVFFILMILHLLMHFFILSPLDKVVQMSRQIAQGRLSVRISLDRKIPDEIDTLALNLNQMALSLENSLKNIEENEKFLQSLIDAIPDALRVIDESYRIIRVNKAYEKLLFLPAGENAVGDVCFHSSHRRCDVCEETEVKCPLKEIQKHEKPFQTIQNFISHNKKKKSFYVDVSAAPFFYEREGKKKMFLVESIRDLTKDIQFSHQQKVSSLGFLSTGIAHEMRNPLGSVRLILEGILERLEKKDGKNALSQKELSDYLKKINEQIGLCIDVTGRLLKMASYNSFEIREKIFVQKTIREILLLLDYEAKKSGIAIQTIFEEEDFSFTMLQSDFQMIFVNLIQNAFHSMKDGGVLTIEVKKMKTKGKITVKDTGCGIPEELLPHIFEPFISSRTSLGGGSGLGLTIVRTLVQSYHGHISVASKKNKGSSFSVVFPFKEEKQKNKNKNMTEM
jgi:nitrogen fixation/metabolism regulation signal transduction histidine kinase